MNVSLGNMALSDIQVRVWRAPDSAHIHVTASAAVRLVGEDPFLLKFVPDRVCNVEVLEERMWRLMDKLARQQLIRRTVLALLTHEMDECLTIDGERRDPHVDAPLGQPSRLGPALKISFEVAGEATGPSGR